MEIDLSYEHKTACPRCRSKGGDTSGDNLIIYGGEQGAHCFSCGYTILSRERREELGLDKYEWTDEEEKLVSTKELLTTEEAAKIKEQTGTDGKGARGISNDVYKSYAVRFRYNEETGDVTETLYPYTEGYAAAGYKVRIMSPKDFRSIGRIGKNSELFGQWRWKNGGGKYVLVTAGEADALAAYQMLEEYRQSRKSDFDPIPVVSSAIGESGSFKQLQLQYEWLNTFDRIVVCYDQDPAGQEAVEKVLRILPKGKAFIVNLPLKDCNEMLLKGKTKQFISCFYDAKPFTPAGIVAADTIYNEIVERSKVQKLPFPPFLQKLNSMLAGGINYGYIVNVLAGSGCGKSAFTNACVSHWMRECGKKVLVVSLEADAAEFGENLLSEYMGRKIAMIDDREERIAYVGSPAAEEAAKELFMFPDGTPRLYLLDDRGDFSQLQEKIEECVTMHDISIVVIDVISDVFSGASLEQVDTWMKWEKNLVKATNCILFQVAHTKKPSGGTKAASQGGTISEEMLIGSGTQFRSAGINIALQRDKSHEDMIMRNTTEVFLLKSRSTGVTGKACELFYDTATAKLWDKEDWLAENPVEF